MGAGSIDHCKAFSLFLENVVQTVSNTGVFAVMVTGCTGCYNSVTTPGSGYAMTSLQSYVTVVVRLVLECQ